MAHKKKYPREYLDKKIFNRLRILTILSILLLAISIYEVAFNGFNIIYALISIVSGLCVGTVVSRMYHLSWDTETNQVVSNMDLLGAIIFFSYILFNIFRSILVGYWTEGTTYTGIIISITAGVMVGRIMGTKHSITRIKEDLESIKKIPEKLLEDLR